MKKMMSHSRHAARGSASRSESPNSGLIPLVAQVAPSRRRPLHAASQHWFVTHGPPASQNRSTLNDCGMVTIALHPRSRFRISDAIRGWCAFCQGSPGGTGPLAKNVYKSTFCAALSRLRLQGAFLGSIWGVNQTDRRAAASFLVECGTICFCGCAPNHKRLARKSVAGRGCPRTAVCPGEMPLKMPFECRS